MKRFILALIVILSTVGAVSAKSAYKWSSYFNFNYALGYMEIPDQAQYNSEYGGSISVGHTYALNKKPIGGFLVLGIDIAWLNLGYSKYEFEFTKNYTGGESRFESCHQADCSLQIGPSIAIKPVKTFTIQAYARYAPTYSIIYMEDTLLGGYASTYVYGAFISYKAFGIGVEQSMGTCTYSNLGNEFTPTETSISFDDEIVMSSLRAYISLKF